MSGNLNVSNNQTDISGTQVPSSKVQALLGAAFLAALGAPSHALGAQDTPLALRMSGSISTQVDSAIAANPHFEFNDTDVALLLKLSDLPTFIEWKKVSTPGIGVDAFAKAAFGPSANWKYLIDKKGKLISGEQGLRHGELYTIAKDDADAKRIIQQIKGANNLKSTNSTPEVVRETLKGVSTKPSVSGLKGEKSVANKVEKSLSYKHLQRPILDFRSVPQEARPEILIGMVQTFKGIPYVWGGNGGKIKNFSVAFDCTGLGNASFYFTGAFKDGTRLTSTQFPGITTNIRSAQLAKRGDIAFIKEDGKTSHITFVLDSASNGHIHVIDAPGKGKVVMERVLPTSAFSFVGTPKIYFDSQVTEVEDKLTMGEKVLAERVDDTFKNEAMKHTSSEGVKKGIEEHIAYFEMLAANDENFKRTVIALKIVEADMKKKLVKKAIEQFTPLANRGVENAENTLKKLVKQSSVLDVRLEKLKTLKAENDTWRNQKFSELIEERRKYKFRIRLSEAQVEKNLPGAQKILLSLQHKLHTVDEAIKILGYSDSEIAKVSEAA